MRPGAGIHSEVGGTGAGPGRQGPDFEKRRYKEFAERHAQTVTYRFDRRQPGMLFSPRVSRSSSVLHDELCSSYFKQQHIASAMCCCFGMGLWKGDKTGAVSENAPAARFHGDPARRIPALLNRIFGVLLIHIAIAVILIIWGYLMSWPGAYACFCRFAIPHSVGDHDHGASTA